MPLTAKENRQALIPEAVHRGVCYGIYDLGTHHDDKWDKDTHKILICWELPDERMDTDTGSTMPRAISRRYTLSLSRKANLRKDLELWRGKAFVGEELDGFDLKNVLGKACQLQILHTDRNERTYANVVAVMACPKGMPEITAENPLQYFSFEDGTDLPENTPDWIVEIIKDSQEWATRVNANARTQSNNTPAPVEDGGEDDNLPF